MKTDQADRQQHAPSLPDSPSIDNRDLASLERLTTVRRFSDGSMDVMFGLGVLLVGITWMLDMVTLGAAIPAMLVPLWVLLHRNVVLPRTGYAEPTEERQRVERSSLALTVLLGAIIFGQLIMAWFGGSVFDMLPESLVDIFLPGLPAALVALFALMGGLITRQKEGSDYALTLVGVAIVGGMNALEPGQILAISGALIVLQAARKFGRFLRANSRVDQRDS